MGRGACAILRPVFVLSNLLIAVARLVDYGLFIFMIIVGARVLISWVSADPRNPIVHFLYRATEWALAPIRNRLPTYRLGLDLSPIILFVVIYLVQQVVIRSLLEYAVRM